jgi:hypothetical protein
MTTEHILGMEPENVARQMIRNYLSLNTRKSVLPESCVSLMMEFNEWLVSTNETYQKLVLDKINTSLPSPMVIERPNSPAISDLAELEGIISELRAQLYRANAAYVSQSDLQSRLQAAEQRLQTMQDALRRLLFACNNQNQITTFGGLLERILAEAEKALAASSK